MQLRREAVEVLVTVKGCRIGMRRMPSILLKSMKQRPIDNVLRFPEHHRKRQRREKVEKLDHFLGRGKVGRVSREVCRLALNSLANAVFERGGIEGYLGGGRFAEESLNVLEIQLGLVEVLLQLIVERNFGRGFQRVGNRDAEVTEKADERGLALKDGAVDGRSRVDRVVDDQIGDLALLIAEQHAQGEHLFAVDVIEQSNHLGRICLGECLYKFLAGLARDIC